MKGFNIMKQAREMAERMERTKKELSQKTVESSVGGGMVIVVVNGDQQLVSMKIDPQVIDPEDPEMLEDLIISAVNQGMRDIQELVNQEMGKLTGGLNIPGLM